MRKPSGFLGNRMEPEGTGDQSPSPSKLIALGVQKVLLPTRTCLTQTGAGCCKTFLEGIFLCMSFVFTLSRHGFARRAPLTSLQHAQVPHKSRQGPHVKTQLWQQTSTQHARVPHKSRQGPHMKKQLWQQRQLVSRNLFQGACKILKCHETCSKALVKF